MSPARRAGDARPNHLAGETSPYLLQHLHNPVDWHPWGPEALERARREDRPIFLSIGYAACHWCHVMERESFEEPRIAALLNGHFVPIKVDREERPDIDEIYMSAVQLMTGHGGWPLSVFLTPGREPFIGGTYFPPEERGGMPGFRALLERVRDAWTARRFEIDRSAARMAQHLRDIAAGPEGRATAGRVGRGDAARAAAELTSRFDSRWGGFGSAPKFPAEGALSLLLDEHVRSGEAVPLRIVTTTLEAMARGGIYDHVGGGFARYAVDERWLVPHFEKMLYNQALLVPVYTDAWLVTRKPLFRRVATETLDFVRRELTSPHGGYYSSLDADSEGVEGRFYVWTPAEVRGVLGHTDGDFFCDLYGIADGGNFEGQSIPNLLAAGLAERAEALALDEDGLAQRLAPLRRRLLEARGGRVRPATDDKILTAWNGLMLSAAARAHQALGRPEDLATARDAAAFVLRELAPAEGLLVSWRAGRAKLGGYLDDHAFLARGLLDLYEAGFDAAHLARARSIARTMLERFEDRERGGFFFTAHDHESLIARNRSSHDGALPAGAGVAAELLLRLAVHTGEQGFRAAAERALAVAGGAVRQGAAAYASTLRAAAIADEPAVEVAIVGELSDPATQALLAVVRGRYRPNLVIQLRAPGADAGPCRLLDGKHAIDGKATAYVCRNYTCARPVTAPAGLAAQLGD